MNLVAVTMADDKFMDLASEQAKNFKSFGVEHVIVPLPPQTHNRECWINKVRTHIEGVEKYGRVFRVDAEVRLHKEIPIEWTTNENVLWHFNPPLSEHVAQGGQAIFGKSSLPFLRKLLELLETSKNKEITDELLFGPALAATQMEYYQDEMIFQRSDLSRSNRGSWVNRDTVLTHPFIHTWNVLDRSVEWYFESHFAPKQSKSYVDAVLLGLKMHLLTGYAEDRYWMKLGAEQSRVLRWKLHGWHFTPPSKYLPRGLIGPEGYYTKPFLK